MNPRALALVASLVLLAGCGGGGGSAVAVARNRTLSTELNGATFSALSLSSVSFAATSSQDSTTTASVTMPNAGGYGGNAIFTNPFSPASASLDQRLTNILPSSVARTIPSGAFVLHEFREKFDRTIQFPAAPAFSFTIPSGVVPPGSALYVGYYDTTTGRWNDTFEGPIAVSGTTATFVSNGKPFTFVANATSAFRLIALPPGVPTLAPSASPAPIALTGTTTDDAAHGGLDRDPNFNRPTLFFVNPEQTESFTASQAGTRSFVFGLDPASCGTGADAIVSYTTSDNKTFNVTSGSHPGLCKGFVTGAQGTGATVWFTNTPAP